MLTYTDNFSEASPWRGEKAIRPAIIIVARAIGFISWAFGRFDIQGSYSTTNQANANMLHSMMFVKHLADAEGVRDEMTTNGGFKSSRRELKSILQA